MKIMHDVDAVPTIVHTIKYSQNPGDIKIKSDVECFVKQGDDLTVTVRESEVKQDLPAPIFFKCCNEVIETAIKCDIKRGSEHHRSHEDLPYIKQEEIDVKDESSKAIICQADDKQPSLLSTNTSAVISSHKIPQPTHFQCSMCGFKTKYKGSLKCHFSIHTREKPFECSFCGYKAATAGQLKQHTKIHTGNKVHSCSVCDFKSVTRSDLKKHWVIHTGEKPFVCHVCGFRSAHKGNVTKHMIKLHKQGNVDNCKSALRSQSRRLDTEEKPFACDVCDFKTFYKGSIANHKAIHSKDKRFKCYICDYESNQKCNLRNHMSLHTGEKPFACLKCDFKTVRKINLAKHMSIIHGEERFFICNICGFKAVRKCGFVKHMSAHSREKSGKNLS